MKSLCPRRETAGPVQLFYLGLLQGIQPQRLCRQLRQRYLWRAEVTRFRYVSE